MKLVIKIVYIPAMGSDGLQGWTHSRHRVGPTPSIIAISSVDSPPDNINKPKIDSWDDTA